MRFHSTATVAKQGRLWTAEQQTNMGSDVKFSWTLLQKEYKPVSAGLGLLLVLLFLEKASFLFGTVFLIFGFFLIVAAILDYRYTLIFDKFLLAFAGVFFMVYISCKDFLPPLSEGFLCGVVCSGIFLVLRLFNGGIGGGDIKFMFCLGLWLGIKLILTVYIAVFAALIFALIVPKYRQKKARIPFAPFLSFGAFVAFLYWERIIPLLEDFL